MIHIIKKQKNNEKIQALRRDGEKRFKNWLLERPSLSLFLSGLISRLDKKSSLYLVGGIVRGIIQGKKDAHDIDMMVVNCDFEKLDKIFSSMKRAKIYKIKDYISAGKSFPVYRVSVRWTEEVLDIALARTEISTGKGHRDFDINTNNVYAYEDSQRRDFTFNAIFFRIKKDKFNKVKGKIVDYQNGITALINREIKAVGKPEDRFIEDPLRMLRAIRQKNQLGFKIEKNTWDSIKKLMPELITTVSSERISTEIIKSFESNPVNSMIDFEKSSFFKIMVPEFYQNKNLIENTKIKLQKAYKYRDNNLIICSLLLSEIAEYEIKQRINNIEKYNKENGKKAKKTNEPEFYIQEKTTEIIKRLSLPNQKYIYYAIYVMTVFINLEKIEYSDAVIEELLRDCPEKDEIIKICDIQRQIGKTKYDIKAILKKLEENPTLITGRELIEAGYNFGAKTKIILRMLRQTQLDNKINDKDILLREGLKNV